MNSWEQYFAWQEFFWNTIQSNGPPSQHQSSLLSIFLSFCAMLVSLMGYRNREFWHSFPLDSHYKRLQELGCKTEQLRVYWMPYQLQVWVNWSRTWLVWSIQWEFEASAYGCVLVKQSTILFTTVVTGPLLQSCIKCLANDMEASWRT
jgi:hypothetical protein